MSNLQDALAQCDREIAACEDYIRAGGTHLDTGACLGLADWSAEKRLIEMETE